MVAWAVGSCAGRQLMLRELQTQALPHIHV